MKFQSIQVSFIQIHKASLILKDTQTKILSKSLLNFKTEKLVKFIQWNKEEIAFYLHFLNINKSKVW